MRIKDKRDGTILEMVTEKYPETDLVCFRDIKSPLSTGHACCFYCANITGNFGCAFKQSGGSCNLGNPTGFKLNSNFIELAKTKYKI